MQTFLPLPDIIESVKCLDNKRLDKQRVKTYQILKALTGYKSRWINHPAVKMWCGYEDCLQLYMNCCIQEWINRGYKNNMLQCIMRKMDLHVQVDIGLAPYCLFPNFYPKWFGNKDFHDSHKSNLLRKYPEHYSQFGWNVPNNLPYIWPVK